MNTRNFTILLVTILATSIFLISTASKHKTSQTKKGESETIQKETVIPTCTTPTIKPAEAYTLIFVGDSMTDTLRPFDNDLRERLARYYPTKIFGIFNYGFGASNILSVPEKLEKETTYQGVEYPAILKREFDIIFIESFGHNPLSEYPLEEGLKKQEETLDKIVADIRKTHSCKSHIVFIATIGPDIKTYAQGAANLTSEQRKEWVAERRAYIENHIRYAEKNGIPLINIYEQSQDISKNPKAGYVETQTNIHPSETGAKFINESIVEFIFNNSLLPK